MEALIVRERGIETLRSGTSASHASPASSMPSSLGQQRVPCLPRLFQDDVGIALPCVHPVFDEPGRLSVAGSREQLRDAIACDDDLGQELRSERIFELTRQLTHREAMLVTAFGVVL